MDRDIKISGKICCNTFAKSAQGCATKLDLGSLVVTIKWEMLHLRKHLLHLRSKY